MAMNTTRNRNFVLILWLDFTDSSTSRAAYLKRKVAEITKEFIFVVSDRIIFLGLCCSPTFCNILLDLWTICVMLSHSKSTVFFSKWLLTKSTFVDFSTGAAFIGFFEFIQPVNFLYCKIIFNSIFHFTLVTIQWNFIIFSRFWNLINCNLILNLILGWRQKTKLKGSATKKTNSAQSEEKELNNRCPAYETVSIMQC